jgi:site-specific DNA-methyltransferase (cytosine-N4-specific)
MKTSRLLYRTKHGKAYVGDCEGLLTGRLGTSLQGKVQLLFTSPPFALNRKKKYGNLQGQDYINWLRDFAKPFSRLLTNTGSIVIELGNAWEPGHPTMSTLAIEALLAFKQAGKFHLCQEFVAFNPARLPTPVQWVTVERCRVKDAFTRVWWLSKVRKPKADNRRVLTQYSEAMRKLLARGTYNAGRRPSDHLIGKKSFLTRNDGCL